MMSLAQRMRVWRSVYGLSQEEAAKKHGVSDRTWRRWENGESEPVLGDRVLLEQLVDTVPWRYPELVADGARTDQLERDVEEGLESSAEGEVS